MSFSGNLADLNWGHLRQKSDCPYTATFGSCFLERPGDFLEAVLRNGEEGGPEERQMSHKSCMFSDPKTLGWFYHQLTRRAKEL